jgi:hypothetical protein
LFSGDDSGTFRRTLLCHFAGSVHGRGQGCEVSQLPSGEPRFQPHVELFFNIVHRLSLTQAEERLNGMDDL